jgi:hypothetical protein
MFVAKGILVAFVVPTLVYLGTMAVIRALTGLWRRRRRHRLACLVVGAITCLEFPFGTILGAFAFVVLGRRSVKALFDGASGAGQPPEPASGPVSQP